MGVQAAGNTATGPPFHVLNEIAVKETLEARLHYFQWAELRVIDRRSSTLMIADSWIVFPHPRELQTFCFGAVSADDSSG